MIQKKNDNVNNKAKTMKFDAEIDKVLHLMINALYTNTDIFLRELISNASDACDKARIESQKINDKENKEVNTENYKISISLDKNKQNIVVQDNGIGMNQQELITNLGTIARSGTQKFLQKLSGDQKKDSELIGQFGVGFYSSYMVADKVQVYSKKYGQNKIFLWESEGKGEFSIKEVQNKIENNTHLDDKSENDEKIQNDTEKNIKNKIKESDNVIQLENITKSQNDKKINENTNENTNEKIENNIVQSDKIIDSVSGTKIILYIKPSKQNQYLDKFHIEHIIKLYSDHISVPVEMISFDEVKKEQEIDVVNSSSALWRKDKKNIEEKEYHNFYKQNTFSADEPWLILHNKNEGIVTYVNLLFIPSQKGYDLFHPDRKTKVKLYVKRVFITEDNADLLPAYLRFVKGVVDSEDIPLNISRENLQNNHVIIKIKESITKKILSELEKQTKKSEEEYQKFWNNFGAVLKEGLCEFNDNKDKILELCRFKTNKSTDKLVSIIDYIQNMKEEQKNIYYFIGDNVDVMKDSPQVESFNEKNIEVLFLTDSVDDFWVNVVSEYKGKALKSVTKITDELDNFSEEKNKDEQNKIDEKLDEKQKKYIDELTQYMKEQLKEYVTQVRISKKLTTSPACLAVSEGGMDIRMERMLYEQKQLVSASKKILEINPHHNIIQYLSHNLSQKNKVDDIIFLLFDQACLLEGEPLHNTSNYNKRVNAILEKYIDGQKHNENTE